MAIVTQVDHLEQGLSKLITQWKDSPNVVGVLSAYLESINTLETLSFQVLQERGIFEAVGVQLDVIGALFGIPRAGLLDEQYRAAILRRIILINTDGTTEVFMQCLRTVSNSDYIDFWEHLSGDVHAWMGSGVNTTTYATMEDLVSAGVDLRIYVDDEGDSFVGAELVTVNYDLQTAGGSDIQVTVDSTLYDLQVQIQQTSSDISSEMAVLPEIQDIEDGPVFAELLFTDVKVVSGTVIDDQGNTVVDNDGNTLIWVDYEF